MYLQIGQADAYGAAFECLKNCPHTNDLKGYYKHPKHPLPAGHYTDDTQMSIAVGEAMLAVSEPSALGFADKFVECFKRDEREGYSPKFYDFLCGVMNGTDFLTNIRPDSEKNGAAMRSVPIGLYREEEKVKRIARLQARITHDTPGGISSSQAVALMAHYFYHRKGSRDDMRTWLFKRHDGPWLKPWIGRVQVHGMQTAHAVCYLLSKYDKQTDILRAAIDFGGDTDSVASIACGIASLSDVYAQDLPECLNDGLENGAYGRSFLIGLDKRIMEVFPKS